MAAECAHTSKLWRIGGGKSFVLVDSLPVISQAPLENAQPYYQMVTCLLFSLRFHLSLILMEDRRLENVTDEAVLEMLQPCASHFRGLKRVSLTPDHVSIHPTSYLSLFSATCHLPKKEIQLRIFAPKNTCQLIGAF